jgi:hypothetical protein
MAVGSHKGRGGAEYAEPDDSKLIAADRLSPSPNTYCARCAVRG